MSRTARVWLATIGILVGMAAALTIFGLIASWAPIVAPITVAALCGIVVLALVYAVVDRYID